MTRSRSPLASGAGPRRQRCRRRPPSPGTSTWRGTRYIADWQRFMHTCSRSPDDVAEDLEDLYLDFRGGPADTSGPDLARRVGGEPVDPVGQRPQRPRRLPPRLDPRPGRIGGRSRRSRGAWVGAPCSRLPRRHPGARWALGPEPMGRRSGVLGRRPARRGRVSRSSSPARCGGRAPATCTAVRAEAALFEHLITEEAATRMIWTAARFIARTGPATGQDRWEENEGLTPSTLAPVVAALVVAADHLPARPAAYCRELADDWNASIEDWTYATDTRLAREFGVDGHYVRIASSAVLGGRSDLDGGADPKPAAGRVQRARRRDGRHRLPGARPLRPAQRGRPADPLDAGRHRRRSSGRRRRAALSGTDTTAMATVSTPTAARTTGRASAAAGRCWSASAATTSSRRAGTRGRTSRRWAPSRPRAGCSPSRSGTQPTSPSAASPSAVRADPRCRSPGLTRST